MSYIEKICFANWRFRSFVQYILMKLVGEWRLKPSVHRAKGDRLVRDGVLPV